MPSWCRSLTVVEIISITFYGVLRSHSFVYCKKTKTSGSYEDKKSSFLANFVKEFSNSCDNISNNNCGNIKIKDHSHIK